MTRKILITAALPYVNNVPHLGNLVGCVLSADVFARYARNREWQVLFVGGTDEHGTTTEAKAKEEGLTPQEISDKYFLIHKKINDWFRCSFDVFGRTTSSTSHKVTQEIFNKLDQNGYIIEKEVEQMFDLKEQKFLADRFVEGTCPHCNYEKATGDQCEGCGKLLDPVDLVSPISKLSGEIPELRKSKHLFVDLPKLAPKLQDWIKSVENNWSKNAQRMTDSWLKQGLKPRCITRDLRWGIPVPKKGYENKVFYSWFDAPIGYISIAKEGCEEWDDWWKKPKDVELFQFIGKDNIPFHTILFPSFLLGTNEDWTLLKNISTPRYI